MKKRILSCFMAFCMILTLVPTAVWADEFEESTPEIMETVTEATPEMMTDGISAETGYALVEPETENDLFTATDIIETRQRYSEQSAELKKVQTQTAAGLSDSEILLQDAVSPQFVIENRKVSPGSEFDVPVLLKNNPGIAGFGLEISYDTEILELTGDAQAKDIPDVTFSQNTGSPYQISLGRMDNFTDSEAVIAILPFRVKEGVTSASTQITVSLKEEGEPYNERDEDISNFELTGGMIQIQSAATPTVINSVTDDHTGNIHADIQCSDTSATVFCASYRENGKMVSLYTNPVNGTRDYDFQFEEGSFSYVKVFVLGENFSPLCESGHS